MYNKSSLTLATFLLLFISASFSQDTINKRKLTARKNCIFYKKGTTVPFTGVAREKFFFSGEIIYRPIESGILSGKVIGYYKSGAKKYETDLKYGEKNGKEIGYYESGKIQYIMFYENGKENGEETQYYENGNMKSKVFVKDDKAEGALILYYPSGIKKTEQMFENGIITNATFYYEDGTLNYSEKYINGKRVK